MMKHFNPQTEIPPSVLATDLDGTLIPLPGNTENTNDLKIISSKLSGSAVQLVYATGRHFESVIEARESHQLPTPEWIVCDVGSAIYKRAGDTFKPFELYQNHLSDICGTINRAVIEETLAKVEGLKPQPPDHQQPFKISYLSSASTVEGLVDEINELLRAEQLPFDCMGSLDPFQNCGLLDVMPSGVSKAYALIWLSEHANFTPDQVIYSGDSGNDYAALTSGFRAIIVANASESLITKTTASLKARKLEERLFIASKSATSGVLEGCLRFGLFDDSP